MKTPSKLVLAMVWTCGVLPTALSGQLAELRPADGTRLEVGVARPFLAGGYSDVGAFSGAVGARIFMPLPTGGAVFVEGGASHLTSKSRSTYGSGSGGTPSYGSTTVSNVTLGVVSGNQKDTWGAFAVTAPTVKSWGDGGGSAYFGVLTDPHHLERFIDEAVTLDGTLGLTHETVAGGAVGGWASLAAIFPVEGGWDSEMIGRYAVFASSPGSVRVRGEITGLVLITEEGSFTERTDHFLGASVALADRASEPELFLRVPLDSDMREGLSYIAGLRFRF